MIERFAIHAHVFRIYPGADVIGFCSANRHRAGFDPIPCFATAAITEAGKKLVETKHAHQRAENGSSGKMHSRARAFVHHASFSRPVSDPVRSGKLNVGREQDTRTTVTLFGNPNIFNVSTPACISLLSDVSAVKKVATGFYIPGHFHRGIPPRIIPFGKAAAKRFCADRWRLLGGRLPGAR